MGYEQAWPTDKADRMADSRVLVVEDDPDARRMIVRMVEHLGYAVHSAGDAAEAMRIVADAAIDFFIFDLRLPDSSGIDLMRALNERQPFRGIALTGSAHRDDIGECLRAGFSRYLTKPVDMNELREALLGLRS